MVRTIKDALLSLSEASRVSFYSATGIDPRIAINQWSIVSLESACTILGLVLVPEKDYRTYTAAERFTVVESRGWFVVKDGKEVLSKFKDSGSAAEFVASRRRRFVLTGD